MIIATVASGLMLGAVAGGASAGNSGDGSEYYTNPGQETAWDNTACAGAGAFGYFGKDHNKAGGADGYNTGLSNSSLCSNRQGNLP